jgi:UDP-2-acetamido-3-amino-2,3-dideoxy-glucuronate N-acetyltransferase
MEETTKKYFAHPTAIVDEGAQIGDDTKIWHFCHISAGAQIGAGCNFGQNVFVANKVVLGKNVKVQNNVSIYDGVTCQDDVFTNVINPRSAVNRKNQYLPTLVKHGASIGANATIVCGCTIGEYAFVGAGAVVRGDVQPFALVVGVPARRKAWVSRHGHRLEFDITGLALCPETGEAYILDGDAVRLQ